MVNISVGYDIDGGRVTLTVRTHLISEYYINFKGMLEKNRELPYGLRVDRRDNETAVVSFPTDKDKVKLTETSETSGKALIMLDKAQMDKIYNEINSFLLVAIKKTLKTVEILPILDFSGGYSLDKLKEDVKTAITNKRHFLLIKNYKEYLDSEASTMKYAYNQYRINYGTDEYCNVALQIESGDINGLRKEYKDKLVYTEWT